MKFRPWSDYVLVKLDKLPEKTKSGIHLPGDSAGEKIRTGTVMRVGPGKWVGSHRQPVGVEPGEKVAFLRWHLEHQTGQMVTGFLATMGDDMGLIRAPDILVAFSAKEKVEIQ